jgi:hypothetical protein
MGNWCASTGDSMVAEETMTIEQSIAADRLQRRLIFAVPPSASLRGERGS